MDPHDSTTRALTADQIARLQLVLRLADLLDDFPALDSPADLRRVFTRTLLRGRAALPTTAAAARDRDVQFVVELMTMSEEEILGTHELVELVAACPGKAVHA